MLSKRFIFLFICFNLFALIPLTSQAQSTPGSSKAVDRDSDLRELPERYRKRVKAFRNIIRKEPNRDAKVRRALSLLKTKYKRDAVRFLLEVHALESIPTLIQAARIDASLRDEVVYAMGQFHTKEAIDYLIEVLTDPREATRAQAQRHLEKITQRIMGYRSSEQDPRKLRKMAKEWKDWWVKARPNFHYSEQSRKEADESRKLWEKYGLPYLNRED